MNPLTHLVKNAGFYFLDGKTPVATDDVLVWAEHMENCSNSVAFSTIGAIEVSTVFLGIDANSMFPGAQPVLFETMVFGGPLDLDRDRYSTWEAAEEGHKHMVQKVRDAVEGTTREQR